MNKPKEMKQPPRCTQMTFRERFISTKGHTRIWLFGESENLIFGTFDYKHEQLLQVKLLSDVDLKGLSWHPKKDIMAFVSARNQVTIRDYGDSGQ